MFNNGQLPHYANKRSRYQRELMELYVSLHGNKISRVQYSHDRVVWIDYTD